MTTFHHALRRHFVFRSLAAWLAAGSMATAAVPAAMAQDGSAAASRTPTGKVPAAVSVLSIVEHPSLDALRDGLHDELKDAGYQDGKSLHWAYQSAQGNQGTAVQIARKFVGDRPDVIVPIATPAAQAVVSATHQIPVVYNAITDPIAAQIVKSMAPSGTNVTGVSDRLEPGRQVELIRKIVPSVKTVGMIYNPAEANSKVAVNEMKAALSKAGIELVEAAAPRSVDVGQAARRLVGKVDLIYTGTDNNVVAAYEAVAKVGNDAKIPLVAADTGSIRRGALAVLSVDYRDLGKQAGKQIVRILKGEKPGDMASETSENLVLILNLEAARKQGVELSAQLQSEASEILGR